MLNPVRAARPSKKRDTAQTQKERAHVAGEARRAYARFCALDPAEAQDRLDGEQWPGARLTAEHWSCPERAVPFPLTLATHREAREWALAALRGQVTIAVDGSQVSLSDEYDPGRRSGGLVRQSPGSEQHEKEVRLRPGRRQLFPAVGRARLDVRRLNEWSAALSSCVHSGRDPSRCVSSTTAGDTFRGRAWHRSPRGLRLPASLLLEESDVCACL